MKLKNLILFLFVFFVACERYESQNSELLTVDSWNVDFSLASGNCVVYNDTLYLLFGRDEGGSAEQPSTKMRYASMSDLSNFNEDDLQIKPRVNATTIVVGDKLYAGLGFCGRVYAEGRAQLQDWWEYDFLSKQWTRLSDFPTKDVVAPVVWNDGNYIYTIFGYNVSSSGIVYRYDIQRDEWSVYSQKSKPWARTDAIGGVVDDMLYCGGGSSSFMKQDWWRYDWKNNTWFECAELPNAARVFASSVTLEKNIYVFGGRYYGGTETREHFFETVIVYDTQLDNWTTVGRMEQAAENMIAFEYKGDLYWGLGQSKDGDFVKKIYRMEM